MPKPLIYYVADAPFSDWFTDIVLGFVLGKPGPLHPLVDGADPVMGRRFVAGFWPDGISQRRSLHERLAGPLGTGIKLREINRLIYQAHERDYVAGWKKRGADVVIRSLSKKVLWAAELYCEDADLTIIDMNSPNTKWRNLDNVKEWPGEVYAVDNGGLGIADRAWVANVLTKKIGRAVGQRYEAQKET